MKLNSKKISRKQKIRKENENLNMGIQKKLKKMEKKTKKKGISKIKDPQQIRKIRELKKRKNDRQKRVQVGKYLARMNDKVYLIDTDEDCGRIISYDRRNRMYKTDTGIKLFKEEEGTVWDIIYYNLYVLTLNTRARNKPYAYWPYGKEDSSLSNSNNDTDSDLDDRLLDSAVVSATSEEDARNFLVDEGYTGIEDRYENGDSIENSIWLDENLSFCNYIGEAYHQKRMLYSRSLY